MRRSLRVRSCNAVIAEFLMAYNIARYGLQITLNNFMWKKLAVGFQR